MHREKSSARCDKQKDNEQSEKNAKTRASLCSLQFNYQKLLRGKLEKWRDLKILSRIFTMEFISRKKEGKENKENKYLFSILHNCRITNYCETFLSLLTHGKLFFTPFCSPRAWLSNGKLKRMGGYNGIRLLFNFLYEPMIAVVYKKFSVKLCH